MKILYCIAALLITLNIHSQKVDTQKSTMSLGPQTSYYVTVQGADADMLGDAWKEYVKEYGKSKNNKKAKEYITENAKVSLINGTSPLTLYAQHSEGKGEATTRLWVDLGGAFANPEEHKNQSAGIETFLYDFWVVARKKAISKELAMEEKRLENLNKDLKKLENKKQDLHNEIDKCKLKIAEAEKNIETNIVDQDNKKKEIDAQKKTVEMVVEKLNSVGKN
jgi:hypothetical protein